MSSENYEESGYNLDVELLTISCKLSCSDPMRRRPVRKTKHLTSSTFITLTPDTRRRVLVTTCPCDPLQVLDY
jgi:hypothetical protein